MNCDCVHQNLTLYKSVFEIHLLYLQDLNWWFNKHTNTYLSQMVHEIHMPSGFQKFANYVGNKPGISQDAGSTIFQHRRNILCKNIRTVSKTSHRIIERPLPTNHVTLKRPAVTLVSILANAQYLFCYNFASLSSPLSWFVTYFIGRPIAICPMESFKTTILANGVFEVSESRLAVKTSL